MSKEPSEHNWGPAEWNTEWVKKSDLAQKLRDDLTKKIVDFLDIEQRISLLKKDIPTLIEDFIKKELEGETDRSRRDS